MSWKDVERGSSEYPLSPSALKTYMRCPKQYEYAYIKGIKKKPNLKMIIGSAVHKGIEANFHHKFKKKKDLKLVDVQDAFRDAFVKERKESDVKLQQTEVKMGTATGLSLTNIYHTNMAPKLMPIMEPETELIDTVPGAKRKLRGFIDLFANFFTQGQLVTDVVTDHKTTTRAYSQVQADTDIQLTAYAFLFTKKVKRLVSRVMFDVMVYGKKAPAVIPVKSHRDMGHLKRFADQFVQIEKGIQSGIFYPTDNHQVCNWCGYRDECHKGRSWSSSYMP